MPAQVGFTPECSRLPDAWEEMRKPNKYDWERSSSDARPAAAHWGDATHAEERWSKEVKIRYDAERRITEILTGLRRQDGDEDALEQAFHENVNRWKADTVHWSSIAKMVAHPSYLRIIGLASYGRNAILRLLIDELQNNPDHWFAALEAITGENPVPPAASFGEAVASWVRWWDQRIDDARRTARSISKVG